MLFFSAAITEFKLPSIMQENKRTCIYCRGLDTECCKYPLMLEEPSAVLQPKCNYCCAAHQHRFDGQKVFKELLREQCNEQSLPGKALLCNFIRKRMWETMVSLKLRNYGPAPACGRYRWAGSGKIWGCEDSDSCYSDSLTISCVLD